MRKILPLLFLCLPIALFAETTEIKPQMDQAYAVYKELFPFLLSEEDFQLDKNNEKLKQLILDLKEKMHSVNNLSEQQKKIPGFAENLQAIQSLLEDASKRFASGNKLYALWKLRAVSSNCLSCHTSFTPDSKFIDNDLLERKISQAKAGEFYIATRQYDKAKKLFIQLAKDNISELDRMQALRKWLVVYVRATQTPQEGKIALQQILKEKVFAEDNKEEIERWISAFSAWEKAKNTTTLGDVKKLIGAADLRQDFTPYRSPVELLRATSALHKLLSTDKLTSADRQEALYLLGFSYNSLRPFFIDETPQFYLERCIREFPGTINAKKSYKLIEQILYSDFGGISGSEISGDELAKLIDLKKIAYNIKDLENSL